MNSINKYLINDQSLIDSFSKHAKSYDRYAQLQKSMAENEDKGQQDQETRDERLDKIKSLIADNSEDAAKVLKMWLNKGGTDRGK